MMPPPAAPTLDEIAHDPARAVALGRDQSLELLARSVIAQSALMARVLATAESAAAPPAAAIAPRWLTVEDVARLTGFTDEHVRDLCRRNVIPSVKPGKYWRIPEDELRAWQAAGRLDRAGSVTLPSAHDSGRGTPRPQGPWPVAVEIRRRARRPSRDSQEVGDGGSRLAHHQRAADPPPDGPARDGAA